MLVVFIPFIIAFGFLYWSTILDEEFYLVSYFFQLLFIPFAILGLHFGVIEATLDYAAYPDLVNQLANTAWYLSMILYFLGALILLWLAGKTWEVVKGHFGMGERKEVNYEQE